MSIIQIKLLFIFPHGREKKKKHLDIIAKLSNFEIRKNKFNVELDFLLNNETPQYIAGTITTALITLKINL